MFRPRAFSSASLIGLVTFALILAACGNGTASPDGSSAAGSSAPGASAESSAPTGELDVVKAAFFSGSFPSLPEAVAIHQGFFEDHGIDYQPVVIEGGGAQQGAAMASGDIDIAPQEVRAVILANAQGGSFTMISGSIRPSLYALVMHPDWPLPNLSEGYPAVMQDLEGARIGVSSLGSGTDFSTSLVLRGADLPEDYVSRIPVGSTAGAILAAWEADQIDGYMTFAPFAELLQAQGGQMVVDLRKGEGPPVVQEYRSNGYVTSKENAENRAEVLSRYVEAIKDAIDFINDTGNTDAVMEAFIAGATAAEGITDEVLLAAIQAVQDGYYDYVVTEEQYDLQLQMLQDFDFLTEEMSVPTYDDVINPELAPRE